MRRFRLALVAAFTAACIVGAPAVAAPRVQSDGSAAPTVTRAYALVQLKGAPVSTSVKTSCRKASIDLPLAAACCAMRCSCSHASRPF